MSDDNLITRAQLLASERDRKGQAPSSQEENLADLYEIRDGARIWMKQCIHSANSKGSGAAQLLYEKATREIERLEMIMRGREGNDGLPAGSVRIIIQGFNAEDIEAPTETLPSPD